MVKPFSSLVPEKVTLVSELTWPWGGEGEEGHLFLTKLIIIKIVAMINTTPPPIIPIIVPAILYLMMI